MSYTLPHIGIYMMNLSLVKKTTVRFINNIAGLAGAAIYANDMSRCRWVGSLNITDSVIFEITEEMGSPFHFENNIVTTGNPDTIDRTIINVDFGTDASNLTAQTTVRLLK